MAAAAVAPRLTRSSSSMKRKASDESEEPSKKVAKKEEDETDPGKSGKGDRPKCRYWAKCFRKNPDHLKNFRHPAVRRKGSKTKAADEDDEDEMDTTEGKATTTRTGRVSKPPTEFKYTKPPAHKNIPQVLLAHKWTESTNPTGWWMSEKLDGLRAYWDGRHFYSRLGNSFHAPEWFIEDLPRDMTLDGELFGGRGKFQSTVSIVKSGPSDRWKGIKFHIFDAPSLSDGFEKRIEAIKEHFEENSSEYAHVVEHSKCKGVDQIKEELKKVEAVGGEGLMIRKPKSKYVNGRSDTLLKIKSFHDAEAVVIGYVPSNSGAYKCGSLLCKMACGTTFKVGSGMTNKDRANPPKKGSIITYRFQELTNSGMPRFPTYVGVRIDMDKPKDAVMPKKSSDHADA